MILVDTNIPLRIAQKNHPHRQAALDALDLLTRRDDEHFVICPQTLYEMYVVFTRPLADNGFGLSAQEAHGEITSTRALFNLLPETTQVFYTWDALIVKYAVEGKQAHDTRFVALMIEHRMQKILTFNEAHFKRYTEIAALNPFDIIGAARI